MSVEASNTPLKGAMRAVEYVRMSTDQQKLSIPAQRAAIQSYAASHGFTIIRSYMDEGRSGLTVHGREGLVSLLVDVQAPQRDFDTILVFDVSRWGRFQDVDEAGYYEFLCRKSGVQVHYCAEQFGNEPGPLTTIIKSIKRMMAAEYSRELSQRVALTNRRLVSQGFLPGGNPGYGLRRMLVAPDGTHKGILGPGVWKSVRPDRVILVPGPDHEVATVRRIFDLFVHQGHSRTEIAELLNSEGLKNHLGNPWTYQQVRQITRSERYAGTIVYGRQASRLASGHPNNKLYKAPRHLWVRGDAGYGELVKKEVVAAAIASPSMKGYRYRTDEALLQPLRRLLSEHGYLSYTLIQASPGAPSPPTLRQRFGNMRTAYERAGYKNRRDHHNTKFNARMRALTNRVLDRIIAAAEKSGSAKINRRNRHVCLLDGRFVKTAVAKYQPICRAQHPRWVTTTQFDGEERYTTVVIRLDQMNQRPLDYFCIPGGVVDSKFLTISAYAGTYELYHFKTLAGAIARAIRGDRHSRPPQAR